MLGSVTLPNVTKYVVTVGKFDTRKIATSFNVEAGYPAAPAYLQTLAVWAERPSRNEPRFRDGYDLHSLRKLLGKEGSDFDYAVLLRSADGFEESWPDLQAGLDGRTFLVFSSASAEERTPNVLLSLREKRAIEVLDLALEIYFTGAAYAIDPYSLEGALTAAVDALGLLEEMGDL